MTEVGLPGLFADAATCGRVSTARAVVFLVGGYDGSGNYGDMVQLQAATDLLARLGDAAVVVPVVEHVHAAGHAELAAQSPQLAAAPICYLADPGSADDGLAPVVLAPDVAFAGTYLYGGGFLNAQWGARKLATVRAVEELARRFGAEPWSISTGLQVEPSWVASLAEADVDLLARLDVFGVRDAESSRAAPRDGQALMTGDDVVGVLGDHVADRAPALPAGERPRINLHLQDGAWVTADAAALERFVAELLAALESRLGRPCDVQPVIAYEDRHVGERPVLARVLERSATPTRTVFDPLVLRPGDLDRSLAVLAAADLTLSCSYHVALTSLLLGVPAALIAGNPYYVQKAAGLRDLFGLSDELTFDPLGSPAAAADRLAAPLASEAARLELRRSLRERASGIVAHRREVEVEVLGRVAAAILARLDRRSAQAEAGGTSSAEQLAQLSLMRTDHHELIVASLRTRQLLEAERGRVAALAADVERWRLRATEVEVELEARLRSERELADRLGVVLGSRSWRVAAPLRRLAALARSRR